MTPAAPSPVHPRYALYSLLVLLALLAAPALAATPPTVWSDTCTGFEAGNETAYMAEMDASFAPISANMTPPADFSNESWSAAFRHLHALMKERYAFTAWRGVDFDALYAAWAPAVAEAERKNDRAAYLRALMGYGDAIHDGHVIVYGMQGDYGAKFADIGGGYGIAVTGLDDGRVIVSYVADGSAAQRAGIRSGDEVTAWNGQEIHAAVNATPTIWAVKKPSTAEGLRVFRERLLTRAPAGTPATVTVQNATGTRAVTLVAADDGYDSLGKTSFFTGKQINDIGEKDRLNGIQPQVSNDTVTYRTLPGGYAYIAVYSEEYRVYGPFKAAVQDAIAKRAPGMVIDLRWNGGGDDNLASCMAGWFVDRKTWYEEGTKYDPGTGTFVVLSQAWTVPRPERYTGPVAVLVSPDTISSGEGLPMIFQRTGTGKVIAWYGSNGAFGMNNFQATMPLGIIVFFPDGVSLGPDGKVQVDSDSTLSGGVAPDIRVPRNEETVARAMAGEDVQLAYATAWLGAQAPPQAAATQKAPLTEAGVIAALGIACLIAARRP